jgi:hypothetical protein
VIISRIPCFKVLAANIVDGAEHARLEATPRRRQ